jgi:hypothetical protein
MLNNIAIIGSIIICSIGIIYLLKYMQKEDKPQDIELGTIIGGCLSGCLTLTIVFILHIGAIVWLFI